MYRRTVTLREMPYGWLWLEHDRKYKSLTRALRHVNADATEIARSKGAVATIIHYEPTTRAGYAVVQMVTENA